MVDRRTNPEIAAKLFPSSKTIETHMRNIFRKLDASSRVDVARPIERAEDARNKVVEPHLTRRLIAHDYRGNGGGRGAAGCRKPDSQQRA